MSRKKPKMSSSSSISKNRIGGVMRSRTTIHPSSTVDTNTTTHIIAIRATTTSFSKCLR